jgi:hypothetical protein
MELLTDYQKRRVLRLQIEFEYYSKFKNSSGNFILPLTIAARKREINKILKEEHNR